MKQDRDKKATFTPLTNNLRLNSRCKDSTCKHFWLERLGYLGSVSYWGHCWHHRFVVDSSLLGRWCSLSADEGKFWGSVGNSVVGLLCLWGQLLCVCMWGEMLKAGLWSGGLWLCRVKGLLWTDSSGRINCHKNLVIDLGIEKEDKYWMTWAKHLYFTFLRLKLTADIISSISPVLTPLIVTEGYSQTLLWGGGWQR